ncbi:transcription factor bHLH25-like isoform X1 [Prosopis cineraria]|uniref:transcription factor bHLH25-like isoform X1 n=1 Tax=Prosopis cineraria TaxID=364024 RepID=UPI00240EF9A5|nr:transcription factor bHLH25-like isoform X1 [Prosopis cineraria]XP_054782355.1 transcription factor bHLH25-like isoform X1 [Prosopis cineraria]
MEVPWQNWFSDLDMDETDFFHQSHKNNSFDDDDEFLREIFHQPSFSSESDSTHSSSIQKNTITATLDGAAAATTPTVSSLSFDNDSRGAAGGRLMKPDSSNSILSKLGSFSDKPVTSLSSSTYILSFDNSTVLPATSDDGYRKQESAMKSANNQEKLESNSAGGGEGGGGGTHGPHKRTLENRNSEPKASHGTTKKTRSSSETLDHIMAERKRRQELTEKFIALSATIPGLKKIDKASILSEAIIHVKQLQERVKELEEQNKKMSVETVSYMLMMKKKSSSSSQLYSNNHNNNEEIQDTTSCEMSSDYYFRMNEALPEVEARVLQKEVLIRIHCENQNGVVLNVLAQLHTLHFSIISHSVLPFGNSALDITIIAEVDEEHSIPVKELVKKLRTTLLKSVD